VFRTALVNRLRGSRAFTIVTVIGPPGSGKTTALAQWAERDGRPFGWVSVDERDNDPKVLLRHVAASLNRIAPLEGTLSKALASDRRSVWTSVLPKLTATMASAPNSFVLVLDDASRVSSSSSLDVLHVLADNLPAQSTLVLSGRTGPALPIASIRAAGRLFEIGPEQLALGRREAESLVHATGVDLGDGLTRLVDRTEGWAAGLFLSCLAIRESGRRDADIAGDDSYVADYFRSECLSRLAPGQLSFLRQASIFDTISAPICDAVLRRTGSARELAAMEGGNLFLRPLDRSHKSYRLHGLFRELLQRELEEHQHEQITLLHCRAAEAYEAIGVPDRAIHHAAAAGDTNRLAELVALHAFPTCEAGRTADVEEWLQLFTGSQAESYPAVALVGAWVHAQRGRTLDARRLLGAAARSATDVRLPDGSTTPKPWTALLQAAMCEDGCEQMLRDAETALAELPVDSDRRPTALLLQGAALALLGDPVRADEALVRAAILAEQRGASATRAAALSERALLAESRGDHASVDQLADEARRVSSDIGDDYTAARVLQLAVVARVRLRRGHWAEAPDELVSARRLARSMPSTIPWLALQTRLELARASITLCDVSAAQEQLAEAYEILDHHPGLGVLCAQAAELRHAVDELREARSINGAGLTRAELRLLPLLASHLSFREIGDRFSVTRNTVKSQAVSLYRKLGASNRSEAIEKAVRLGLIDYAPPGSSAAASLATA
jgi:LuxR family maltose regulon positive regulatory protein